MLLVSVVCGAVVFGSVEMPKWAVSDAVLAMPFYAVGYLLACSCREAVLGLVERMVRKRVVVWMSVVVMLIVLFLIGRANGQVGMYKGYYGNSMLLFLLGGMLGSVIVFMISAMLSKVKRKFVSVVAAGNIVILVFHRELLHSPLKMIVGSELLPVYKDMLSAVLSLAVLFCFVPICWLLIKYVPIVVGCRKV